MKKKKNLGCLTVLILLFAAMFVVAAISVVIGAILDPGGLNEENEVVSGLQFSAIVLVILGIIFFALGGKLDDIKNKIKGKSDDE